MTDRFKSIRNGSGLTYLVASVFAVIAVMGFLMIYNSPSAAEETSAPASVSLQYQQTPADYSVSRQRSSSYVYMLKFITVTALVLVSLFVAAKFIRGKTGSQSHGGLRMNILGRQYIGPRNSIMMIQLENRRFLLGVTDQSVNLIGEFDAVTDEELNEMNAAGINSFSSLVSRLVQTGRSGK